MKVTLDQAEWHALNELRGLPESAHYLVMCGCSDARGGATLDGSKQAFRELIEHIGADLADGMLRGRSAEVLYALCVRIDPKCASWLGS